MIQYGMVIPFLGAAASAAVRRSDASAGSAPQYLPSGTELAHELAGRARPEFPSNDPVDRDDLAKVASWYVANNGRETMRVILRDRLAGSPEASPPHDLLATAAQPAPILTANPGPPAGQALQCAGKT